MILQNVSLIVTAIEHNTLPFTWRTRLTDVFEGLDIDLVKGLSGILGFQSVLRLANDGQWGKRLESNRWTGMIGEVLDGVADMAVSTISMSPGRQKYVDFSVPFLDHGITILHVQPQTIPLSFVSFLRPFSTYVWIAFAILAVVTAISACIFERLSRFFVKWNQGTLRDQTESATLGDTLWMSLAIFLRRDAHVELERVSARLVVYMWSILVLMMVSLYSAILISYLVQKDFDSTINSAADLLHQDRIKFGTTITNSDHFRESTVPMVQALWLKILEFNKTQEVLMSSVAKGLERVKLGDFALFTESTFAEAIAQRDCNLRVVGGLMTRRSYAIVFRKGYKYYRDFNSAMIRLLQTGTVKELRRKWQKRQMKSCDIDVDVDSKDRDQIEFANVQGIFLILLLGVATAAALAVIEVFWVRLHPSFVEFKR